MTNVHVYVHGVLQTGMEKVFLDQQDNIKKNPLQILNTAVVEDEICF